MRLPPSRSPLLAILLGTVAALAACTFNDPLADWRSPAPRQEAAAAPEPEPDTAYAPDRELRASPYSLVYEARFLYRDSTMLAPANRYLEIDPIDRMFEDLRDNGLKCLASQRVRWQGDGGESTSFNVVMKKWFVIECRGNCDDLVLEFRPRRRAWHAAMAQPFPFITYQAGFNRTTLVWYAHHRGEGGAPHVRVHMWGGTGDYGPGCDIDPMM